MCSHQFLSFDSDAGLVEVCHRRCPQRVFDPLGELLEVGGDRVRAPAAQPVDTGSPSRSASSCAVRATGMMWRHPRHRSRCRRCSVTGGRTGGRSTTCRRITPARSVRCRPVPHPEHTDGAWSKMVSGFSTRDRFAPGCLPCLRPDLPRSDLGAGLPNRSEDGGIEELPEFVPSRRLSAATSARSAVISSRARASSTACAATSAAGSPYDGRTPSPTTRFSHRPAPSRKTT